MSEAQIRITDKVLCSPLMILRISKQRCSPFSSIVTVSRKLESGRGSVFGSDVSNFDLFMRFSSKVPLSFPSCCQFFRSSVPSFTLEMDRGSFFAAANHLSVPPLRSYFAITQSSLAVSKRWKTWLHSPSRYLHSLGPLSICLSSPYNARLSPRLLRAAPHVLLNLPVHLPYRTLHPRFFLFVSPLTSEG